MQLRIAHVTATFPPYYSGTGMVCLHNAVGLARLGHEVTVITAAHPPGEYEYPSDITVRRLPVKFRIGNAPLLPSLLKLKNYDIIHLHHPFIFGTELVCVAARAKGIPLVMTHHNDLVGDGLRPLLFNMYSALSLPLLFSTACKFIAVSLDHARECRLAPRFQQRWRDVIEIPNGVDETRFKPGIDTSALRQRLGIPSGAKVALFVGVLDRAHHFKGVNYLLQAFAVLNDPKAHLLIVGEGEMRNNYEEQAKSFGLFGKVHFVGAIPNNALPDYYNAANLVVLPSLPPESFGVVLLEGMACNLPVIASDIPGVRTVVDNGRDGLLVPPANVEALSQALHTLLADTVRSEEMGSRGRKKVETLYSWSVIGHQLEEIYFNLLGHQMSSASVTNGGELL